MIKKQLKVILISIVILLLFSILCYGEEQFDIEGIWGNEYYQEGEEYPTFLSIEKLAENLYFFIWYNLYNSELTVIGKLSYDESKGSYFGVSTEGKKIILNDVDSFSYHEMISIGFLLADDGYYFIRLNYSLGDKEFWDEDFSADK